MKIAREGTKEIGPLLREARKACDMTLSTLSQETGISTPYLSLIERSKVTNPTFDVLRRIVSSLRVTLQINPVDPLLALRPLAYESPLTLAGDDNEEPANVQIALKMVADALRDETLPLEYRQLLVKQIAGLIETCRESAGLNRDRRGKAPR